MVINGHFYKDMHFAVVRVSNPRPSCVTAVLCATVDFATHIIMLLHENLT